jgi:hypothetical protein
MGLRDWFFRKNAPPEPELAEVATSEALVDQGATLSDVMAEMRQKVEQKSSADPLTPHMPQVDAVQDPGLFATARRVAVGLDPNPFGVEPPPDAVGKAAVVVTPGGLAIPYEVPLHIFPVASLAASRQVLPDAPRKAIAVIAYTAVPEILQNPDACIPFRGFLIMFASRGHIVWVFEGHPLRLAAGCRGADILLLDWGMLPHLQPDWKDVAASVMRGNELWIHDRERYRLVKTTFDNLKSADGPLLVFREPPTIA